MRAASGLAAEDAAFIRAVERLVESAGDDERRWVADWCADFEEAKREGDDKTTALLLDALIAFGTWLSSAEPAGS